MYHSLIQEVSQAVERAESAAAAGVVVAESGGTIAG